LRRLKHVRRYRLQHDEEEYATELSPRFFHADSSEEHDLLTPKADTGVIIGYIALFLALFSIVFYPIIFGALAVGIGLLAVRYGAKTLGFTAIGFGAFSVLFSLLSPFILPS
jgi:hypothetical protein